MSIGKSPKLKKKRIDRNTIPVFPPSLFLFFRFCGFFFFLFFLARFASFNCLNRSDFT